LKVATEDKDAARFLASLGLSNLHKTASANVGQGINAEETFVEFCKLEFISPQHPKGGLEMKTTKPDKDGIM